MNARIERSRYQGADGRAWIRIRYPWCGEAHLLADRAPANTAECDLHRRERSSPLVRSTPGTWTWFGEVFAADLHNVLVRAVDAGMREGMLVHRYRKRRPRAYL
jgi:hypothetical protein